MNMCEFFFQQRRRVKTQCLDIYGRSTNRKHHVSFRLRSQFRYIPSCTSLRLHSDGRWNENTHSLFARCAFHPVNHSMHMRHALIHSQRIPQKHDARERPQRSAEHGCRSLPSLAILESFQGLFSDVTLDFSVFRGLSLNLHCLACTVGVLDADRYVPMSSMHQMWSTMRDYSMHRTPKPARGHAHENPAHNERSLVWQVVV